MFFKTSLFFIIFFFFFFFAAYQQRVPEVDAERRLLLHAVPPHAVEAPRPDTA